MDRNGMVGEVGGPFSGSSSNLPDSAGQVTALTGKGDFQRPPYQRRPFYHLRPEAGHRYLYVLTDGTATKIGVTGDVRDRLKRLSVASGRHLTVAAAWMFKTDRALWIEARALERLDAHRLPGEWVSASAPHVVAVIDRLISASPDNAPISNEAAVAMRWAVQRARAARRGE